MFEGGRHSADCLQCISTGDAERVATDSDRARGFGQKVGAL